MREKFNKWKNSLIPGILMHISLGIIFTWTVLEDKISSLLSFDCSWIYVTSMLGMGISCAIFGYFIDRCIKCSSKLCLLLYSLGLVFLIGSLYFKIVSLLFIGSILLGFSFGFMLLVPIKNILLWFNSSKGLAIGTCLTFFGIFRGLSSFLDIIILKGFSCLKITCIFGTIGLILLSISTYFTKFPERTDKCDIRISEWIKGIFSIVRIKKLHTYWIVLFLGIVSGYSLLTYKKILIGTLNLEHLTELFLILGATFNIIGRLGIGAWSDKVKNKTKLISFSMYISSLVCILGFIWPGFIPVTIILCSMLYGSLITIMPISLDNCYGSEKIGESMGFVFSAITTGGIIGYYASEVFLNLPEMVFRTVILLFGVIYALGLYLSSNLFSLQKLPSENPKNP